MKHIHLGTLFAIFFVGFVFGLQHSVVTRDPPRAGLISTSVNNLAMFTGGSHDLLLDTYNADTNSWNQTYVGWYATAAVSAGNFALFHCYTYKDEVSASSTIQIFDATTQTWSSKFFEDGATDVLTVSCGRYAIIGARSINQVWVFDSTDQSWRTINLTERYYLGICNGDLAVFASQYALGDVVKVVNVTSEEITPYTRSYMDASQGIASAGKFVLIAGGTSTIGNAYSDRVDIFDTETQTWSVGQLSQKRRVISSASVGNYVIFAGGIENGNGSDRIDVFDTATMTWTTASLAYGGFRFTTVVAEPYVLIGGAYQTNNAAVTVFNSTDQTWFTVALSSARYRIGAAAVGNVALFAGGYSDSQSQVFNTADIFDFTEDVVSTPPVDSPVSGVSFVMPTDDATVRNGKTAKLKLFTFC